MAISDKRRKELEVRLQPMTPEESYRAVTWDATQVNFNGEYVAGFDSYQKEEWKEPGEDIVSDLLEIEKLRSHG